MSQEKSTSFIKLSPIYFLNERSAIALENGQISVGEEQFVAVGLEKTKADVQHKAN